MNLEQSKQLVDEEAEYGSRYYSIDEITDNIEHIFDKAGDLYKDLGFIYISRKYVHDVHLAVLPTRSEFVYDTYTLSDEKDVKLLRDYYKNFNILKCYDCSLCCLKDPRNAIKTSDEQNKLTIKTKLEMLGDVYIPSESPAFLINYSITGASGKTYTLSGNVPQYYYNHLMFTSENHIPTYSVFLNKDVFSDLLLFLKACSDKNIKNIRLHLNGNFGSDTSHFHTHLTNQEHKFYAGIEEERDNETETTIFNIGGTFKGVVIRGNDLYEVFTNVKDTFYKINAKYDVRDSSKFTVTASFHATKRNYYVYFQVVNRRPFVWKRSSFILFPTSRILLVPSNFAYIQPKTNIEFDSFNDALRRHYETCFEDLSGVINRQRPATLTNDWKEDFLSFHMWFSQQNFNINNPPDINLLRQLAAQCWERPRECSRDRANIYKFIVSSMFIMNQGLTIQDTDEYRKLAINNEKLRINNLNYNNKITTDYMYFRGELIQTIIKDTINNLLLVTSSNSGIRTNVYYQTKHVAEWIIKGNRIGERSASGTNFKASVSGTNIDLVIKMMRLTHSDGTHSNDKEQEFWHEFFTGLIINDIREYIPNFILTYGGYICDADRLGNNCDREGNNSSYLLIELVKDSNTISRNLRNTILTNDDLVNIITQTLTTLQFSQQKSNFTHYDLHLHNAMIFNVHSREFNNQFRGIIPDFNNKPYYNNTNNFIFRYFMDENDKNKSMIIPSKYLVSIIDYGNSYVDGLGVNNLFLNRNNISYGMTMYKTNPLMDMYTFCINIVYETFNSTTYKNQILGDKTGILYRFIEEFFSQFGNLWTVDSSEIMSYISNNNVSGRYFESITKPKYLSTFTDTIEGNVQTIPYNYAIQFIHPEFKPEDMKSWKSPEDVVKWLYDNHYKSQNLENVIENEDTYVFNWGYSKEHGFEDGIQVTEQVQQNINKTIKDKRDLGDVVSQFMSKVLN